MTRYELSHLADHELLRGLNTLVKQDRATTAELLAHLAEVDERKLYLPAGYPSMFAWCLGHLRLSDDAAVRRIAAARVARKYPAIFPALADGRLHMTAVAMLEPHLSAENAEGLIASASCLRKEALQRLLAERFPQPAPPDMLVTLAPVAGSGSPAQVVANPQSVPAPARVDAPGALLAPRPRLAPVSSQAYALQCTLTVEAHELLTYAQALEGHAVAPGDLGTLLLRALRSHVAQLERRKFARRSRLSPRRGSRATKPDSRHVPAHVRREVWQRDQGRCTFVGENGHRCEATQRLEFDHATPFARDGEATDANIRLRCRGHNQYEAEQAYGREFMEGKKAAAHARKSGARKAASAAVPAHASPASSTMDPVAAPEPRPERESLVPWLRALGSRPAEARELAAIADAELPDGTLEERIKLALKHSRQVGVKVVPALHAQAAPA